MISFSLHAINNNTDPSDSSTHARWCCSGQCMILDQTKKCISATTNHELWDEQGWARVLQWEGMLLSQTLVLQQWTSPWSECEKKRRIIVCNLWQLLHNMVFIFFFYFFDLLNSLNQTGYDWNILYIETIHWIIMISSIFFCFHWKYKMMH